MAAGRDNRAIADELTLSVRTVERHLQTVYRKLDLTGSAQRTAAALGLRRGAMRVGRHGGRLSAGTYVSAPIRGPAGTRTVGHVIAPAGALTALPRTEASTDIGVTHQHDTKHVSPTKEMHHDRTDS